MNKLSIHKVQDQIQTLYAAHEFQSALNLVEETSPAFPEEEALWLYWRITLALRLHRKKQALLLLVEALKAGHWFSEVLLRKNPVFSSLQGEALFEEIVAKNLELANDDPENHLPVLVLHRFNEEVNRSSGYPLILGLHADMSSAQASLPCWQNAAQEGWLVALPQSSQVLWRGHRVWSDYALAESDIQTVFKKLNKSYAIDLSKIILAGQSHGGDIAMRLALTGAVSARGVIYIAPPVKSITDLESWGESLAAFEGRQLRCAVIYGEKDQRINREALQFFVRELESWGIPGSLIGIPQADDITPANLVQPLHSAIHFITLP